MHYSCNPVGHLESTQLLNETAVGSVRRLHDLNIEPPLPGSFAEMRYIVALVLLTQYVQALCMASARCAKVVRELLPNNQRATSTAEVISHQTAKDFVQGVAEAADAIDILCRLSKSREGCSVVRRALVWYSTM
jgi:hypothetical protein